MKHKIIYLLLFTFTIIGGANAQLECPPSIDVTFNEDGEGQIVASDLVPNIEFLLANGTVTYFVLPFSSGVFNSADDIIDVSCVSAWSNLFIVEYSQNGDLIENCSGYVNVFDPFDGCPNYSTYCEQLSLECKDAVNGYSIQPSDFSPIPAENFALCSDYTDCQGEYRVAVGHISNAGSLDYDTHLNSDDVDEYITSCVLSYTENGVVQYDNFTFYVWENLDCFLITRTSRTIDLDLTAETVIVPSMFLQSENTCTDLTLAVTDINGDVPTDFYDDITLTCDDLGYQTVYIKDAETGFIGQCQLLLADPLETCGTILGPGDKLISMSNNPPVGTYAKTEISVNGISIPASPAGKGWIINEDMLVDGTNTLVFDPGPFTLNGTSTLDIVLLRRLIIFDDYDSPIQSIVMDMDNSGYNGIGDMVMVRNLILGIPVANAPVNSIFKSKEFQIPSTFDPFDFDYDFTTYDFEKSDFDDLSFKFEAYKMGDFNGTAALEDGLKVGAISSTRDLEVFEVSDMEVEAGVPFTFTLSYESDVPFVGLLAALVSNGIKFESMTSLPSDDVQHNIIDDNEIRISFITPIAGLSISNISFEISATSSVSGSLIDLLGLKSGFPQEVIDANNQVIDIDDIEESTTTSISEEEISSLEVSIYPNPANQKLVITLSDGVIGKVEILDPLGKRVLSGVSETNEMQFDVSQLAKGIYHVNIENNRKILNKSFIKM